MLKAVLACWLSNGQATNHVMKRYTAIILACGNAFNKSGDCNVKGIRNELMKSNIILMLLCVADVVLKPINEIGSSLQQSGFQFSCGSPNVLDVQEKLHLYKIKCQEQ